MGWGEEEVLARLREALPTPIAPRRASGSVHTLYWGAHRLEAGTLSWLDDEARRLFAAYAESPLVLAEVLRCDIAMAERVHGLVRAKLERRPIEDLRVDFEDGYGLRSDAEEDHHAERAARAAAEAPPEVTVGLRMKSLTPEVAGRGLRTLERFATTLLEARGGAGSGMVVTLPKVTVPEQPKILSEILSELEAKLSLREGEIALEIMVEVPQALFDPQGRLVLPSLLAAGGERLVGVHLGVYDFTTAYGVAPTYQAMDHPACDFARALMRLSYSGTGRVLSAGSTNVLPVEPGTPGDAQSRLSVHRAWELSAEQIRHTLIRGYYHGWDLHPGQVPMRFASCYRFFLEGYDEAAERMRSYLASTSAATDETAVLDDAATGQALLELLLRAHASGAISNAELEAAGLSVEDVATGSFAAVLAQRLAAPPC